jgi:UDP-glucose 4-epimerase
MTQETWLLTGGAGYIGTHIADEFIRAGKSVVIYDSLYQGLESRIVYLRAKHNVEIPLIKADIRDYNEIESVIRTHKIDGIVHAAALKAVGESMEKPNEYFEVNLDATTELLEIAKRNGVKKFIFSSRRLRPRTVPSCASSAFRCASPRCARGSCLCPRPRCACARRCLRRCWL